MPPALQNNGENKINLLRSFTTLSKGSVAERISTMFNDDTSSEILTLEKRETMAITSGLQCWGILLKKVLQKRKRPIKWVKRFFIIKDSFLLYYQWSEQKTFLKKLKMNHHPRGVIALGNCTIIPCQDEIHKNTILITGGQCEVPIILSAPTPLEQERWISAMNEASKATLKNNQLNESMIRDLEAQGLRLHKEKQEYKDKLQMEANALRDEIDRNEELERVRVELEWEKEKLEQTAKELQSDLDRVRQELEMTEQIKKTLEQEKLNLNAKTEHLRSHLEELEMEKIKTEELLAMRSIERDQFVQENLDLSQTTLQLQSKLENIEHRTKNLQDQKLDVEEKLSENWKKTTNLEAEKDYYSTQAMELMSSLNDLSAQKQMTEQELKDEVMSRVSAEKQLKAAEKALEHLETAMRLSGAQLNELKEQIMPDVYKLKEFFEECAEEARLDANRPVIMKNAVYARRSFLRKSKTKLRNSIRRAEATKKRLSHLGDFNATDIDSLQFKTAPQSQASNLLL